MDGLTAPELKGIVSTQLLNAAEEKAKRELTDEVPLGTVISTQRSTNYLLVTVSLGGKPHTYEVRVTELRR